MAAMLLRVMGFIGGYSGPFIFAPEANQGPLLRIFITCTLGFSLGVIIGLLIELKRCHLNISQET